MLSTKYRLRLEFICDRIVKGEEVKLEDMIWAEKLAKANHSAMEILKKSRRIATTDAPKGGLDEFLNAMNLGDSDPSQDADDLASWFHVERTDDWTTRD